MALCFVLAVLMTCLAQLVGGQSDSLSFVDSSSTLDTSFLFPMDTTATFISPSSTTTSITPSVPDPSTTPTSNFTELFAGTVGCSCDLCVRSCDINCCCDQDCSSLEVATFSQCDDRVMSSDTRICITAETVFRSTFTSSSSSSRLFCVYTDNYPGRLQFTQPQYITTAEELTTQLASHTTAGDIHPPPPSLLLPQRLLYRTGDPVEVVFTFGARGLLSLPSPLNSRQCHDGNPITYLSEQTFNCERRWTLLEDVCSNSSALNALNYYTGFTILTLPSSYSSSANISITLGTYECRNLTGHVTSCDSPTPPPPLYNSSSMSCDHVLLELTLTLTHNGSQGITAARADIVTGQISNDFTSLQQRYAVMFTGDGDLSVGAKRSGNPGYITGRPVLAGVLEGERVNISADSREWLTVMVGGRECGTAGQRLSVLFREDLKAACILRVPVSEVIAGCSALREQTLEILWAGSRVNRVGVYGNADPLNATQWVPLLTTPPSSSGCQSVVTGIQLLFLFSYTGTLSSPQATITGAELRYITQEIQPLCSGSSCSSSSSIRLTLETSISFIPTYSPPAQTLRSTTTNTRTLPQDFLYPFFIPSSAPRLASLTHTTVIVTALLVILAILSH